MNHISACIIISRTISFQLFQRAPLQKHTRRSLLSWIQPWLRKLTEQEIDLLTLDINYKDAFKHLLLRREGTVRKHRELSVETWFIISLLSAIELHK